MAPLFLILLVVFISAGMGKRGLVSIRDYGADIRDYGADMIGKYFSLSEVDPHGKATPQIKQNLKKVVSAADLIREQVGRLKVTSGYRPLEYNRSIGSPDSSYHVKGFALDLKPLDTSVEDLHNAILGMIDNGEIPNGGVGIYDTFVHYDTEDTGDRWDKRTT